MNQRIFSSNAPQRLRTFINESLTAIFFVEVETMRIVYANTAVSTMTGYSREELLNLSLPQLVDRPEWEVEECISELLLNGKVESGERIWKTKDGDRLDVLVNCFCQKEEPDVIFICAQNISERKRAEEELQSSNRELETFIYKVSHDIRGPLASIVGLVNVSRLEVKDTKSLQYLGMVEQAAQKLDNTLTELVQAMKIKNVKQFSDEINFEILFREALAKFAHYNGFSRLRTDVRIAVTKKHVSNRVVIETIIQNLIENCIKYQRKEVTVPFMNIEVTESDSGVTISIEDNGIGIDQAVQSQVYEMYFRGTSSAKGSGLGLYLVKKAIEKLNGRIQLISEAGSGTTFMIHLPDLSPAA